METTSLQFHGALTPIYEGAAASRAARWVATDFYDRVLAACPSAPALFWPGRGSARPIPGLPDSNGWDGVAVVDSHVVLWREDLLKWSAADDFSLWIPVSTTAATGRALVESDFVMPATGATSSQVYLTDVAGEAVVGQFVRIVTSEEDSAAVLYDYFTVASVSASAVLTTSSIKRPQTVAAGEKRRVYLQAYDLYLDWPDGSRLKIDGEATQLKVTGRSRNVVATYQTSGTSGAIPAVGGTLVLAMSSLPSEYQTGDVISVGPLEGPGQDLYRLSAPPGYQMTLTRLDVGDRVPGTTWLDSTYVTFQNWVEVENVGSGAVIIPAESEVSVVDSLTLTALGYTGGTAPGASVPAGAVVETVDTNDAGELRSVGAEVNGPIFAVTTIANNGYVLKRRSIQSLQPVGQVSGTFQPRREIDDDGPVGRYAWCRYNDQALVFLGAKNFYVYAGGQNLKPVAYAHWDEFVSDMDRGRLDEIVAYHNRPNNEVWFAVPATDSTTKVFIYNYVDETITEDRYPADINGITAAGRVEWELAPTWESLDTSETYITAPTKRWYEYVDVPAREYTLLGIGGDKGNSALGEDETETIPRLLLFGRSWSRASRDDCNPEPIVSVAETGDFDFGDPDVWKYVDTVMLRLALQGDAAPGSYLRVEVGARDNLLSPVRWSQPKDVALTSAIGAGPTKINVTISGRLIRLRFSSRTVDAHWVLSGFEIIARKGGSY